jgi:hypothetical protein
MSSSPSARRCADNPVSPSDVGSVAVRAGRAEIPSYDDHQEAAVKTTCDACGKVTFNTAPGMPCFCCRQAAKFREERE